MNDNSIDKLLTEINSSKNYQLESFRKHDDEIKYRKEINYLIDELKLISRPFTNAAFLHLTVFGNEVMKKSGWIKYIKDKENNDNEIYSNKIKIEKAELENLHSNTLLNKWLIKTKWIPHIISIISIIIAVVFGYLTIVTDNNNSKLESDLKELKLKIEKVKVLSKKKQ